MARSGKTLRNHAAVPVRLIVEVSHGWQAEVSEIVTQFLKAVPSELKRTYYTALKVTHGDSKT